VHVCLLAFPCCLSVLCRFLQEYKSEISYTPEDGHVGRNM
jgi:hypothetical protein